MIKNQQFPQTKYT